MDKFHVVGFLVENKDKNMSYTNSKPFTKQTLSCCEIKYKSCQKRLKKWCGNRCYVTVDHLAQLNREVSGNPSFNGKCGENVHRVPEIPLLYHSSFPIIEQDSQNLRNLCPKRRVVWGKDGQDTDHRLHVAGVTWVSECTDSTCNAWSIHILLSNVSLPSQVDQRKSQRPRSY